MMILLLIFGVAIVLLAAYMRHSHGRRAYDRMQAPRPTYNKKRRTEILENLYKFIYYLLFAVGFICILFYMVDRYH